ncbi:MAG: FkbM family methyltransferase [Gammaproteobacteria bacterium]|nr:FkbM family methyltransferase [Gammaproteobacteria bacterium]
MRTFLKKIASYLPKSIQHSLKRRYFSYQIRNNTFRTDEPEFAYVDKVLKECDWVIDIGANIGHYTLRFAELVGPQGRVIAFEPVPETFDLLSSNVWQKKYRNVTLINAAASDVTRLAGMDIPSFDTGLENYYMAHLTQNANGLQVLCLQVDGLSLLHPVSLVKIDAEGHDFVVLNGMKALLERDRPVVIIEEDSENIKNFMSRLGYQFSRLPASHNALYRYEPENE